MGSIPRPFGRKAGEQPAGMTLVLILRPLGRGYSLRFSEYFKMLKTGNCGTLIDTTTTTGVGGVSPKNKKNTERQRKIDGIKFMQISGYVFFLHQATVY